MIHTGVYGVGSRINARSNVSLCMAAIISGEAAVEESADRPGIAGMQVEVVMAETLELHALHRAAPHPRELVRVVRADQRVGATRDDERGQADFRRVRRGIERMPQEVR